jgi:hypothetical protein
MEHRSGLCGNLIVQAASYPPLQNRNDEAPSVRQPETKTKPEGQATCQGPVRINDWSWWEEKIREKRDKSGVKQT